MSDQKSTSELARDASGNVASGPWVQAVGWMWVLAIVGLWIGAAEMWRQGEPQQLIVEAEYTVEVNQASEMDLLNLPEVGPSLAGKILAYRREHGDFHSLSDLGKVAGVGPQTLKQLAPFLSFTVRSETLTDDTLRTAQSREQIAP